MNQIEAMKRLSALGVPSFATRDAATILRVTTANASTILRRLQQQGFLIHLARGRWGMARGISRFALPELLAVPDPAYVSLQSALFHHGLIEQVPAVIYAITLGRTRRIETSIGTVSFHRVPPDLFTGFELNPSDGAKIATAEKAVFDILYLAPARSRLFAQLPELELPRKFHWSQLKKYIDGVASDSRRTFLAKRVDALARH